MNVQTGWKMYGVEKRREGICPGWKNDGRENVWGGKMTGDSKNDGREYVREGNCP